MQKTIIQALTNRCKDELIKSNTLQSSESVARASHANRESAVQESEPPKLHRRHNARVCHEPDHSFKIERRRQMLLRLWRQEIRLVRPWHLAFQLVDLNVEEVILVSVVALGSQGVAAGLLHARGCEGLCDCVCNTTEDLCVYVSGMLPSSCGVIEAVYHTALVIMVVRSGRAA
jgi:hypothetical protein